MEISSDVEEQKKSIGNFARIFLKKGFNFSPRYIKVIIQNHLVVVRADTFLSPAEILMGEEGNLKLIQEMYEELFHQTKLPLLDHIKRVFSREEISGQISIDIETKQLIMTFFFGSN